MATKQRVVQKKRGRFSIQLVIGVSLVLVVSSYANAAIYLSGTDGAGPYAYVFTDLNHDEYVFTDLNHDEKEAPVPRGIVTSFDDIAPASAPGSYGTAYAFARLTYSANADSLGFIPDGTVGNFSIAMRGYVNKTDGMSWAGSTDAFGIFFLTDSYYQYEITTDFYTFSSSQANINLSDRNTSTDLYRETVDGGHSVFGSTTGLLEPGSYVFNSSLLLQVLSSSTNYFDFNSLNAVLTLTPTTAPVPLPGSCLLLLSGLGCLIWRKKRAA